MEVVTGAGDDDHGAGWYESTRPPSGDSASTWVHQLNPARGERLLADFARIDWGARTADEPPLH